MTKQHFEFVASLISAVQDTNNRQMIAVLAAAKFSKENERFDSDRFMSACNVTK
jgi:hypothetical protein